MKKKPKATKKTSIKSQAAAAAPEMIRVYNQSKQMVPLQLKPPNGDFFLHEMQVRIAPGKTVLVPANFLLDHQIQNLSKKRILRIVYRDK